WYAIDQTVGLSALPACGGGLGLRMRAVTIDQTERIQLRLQPIHLRQHGVQCIDRRKGTCAKTLDQFDRREKRQVVVRRTHAGPPSRRASLTTKMRSRVCTST